MRYPVRLPLLLTTLLVLAVPAVRAEKPQVGAILFKDGYSLQGYIVREKKTIVDAASGQPYQLPEGFFLIDDLVRHVIFSPAQIQKVMNDAAFNPDADALLSPRSIDYTFAKPLPPIRGGIEAGPFDARWDREYYYRTTSRKVITRQHLAVLTPYYARLDSVPHIHKFVAMPYRWNSYYVTHELGADLVRTLLKLHPDLRIKSDMSQDEQATRRLKVAQFLLSAGWLDEAKADLESLERDLPGQKDRVASGLAALRRLHATRVAQDLRQAYRAGRFREVRRRLTDFSEDGADEQVLTDVRALRGEAEEAGDNADQARRYLKELADALPEADRRSWLGQAAAAVRAELAPDTVGRLQTFLAQARQAERQRKAGKTPELAPPQLLSLAVSGWLLGNTSAEAKVAAAGRLWRGRELVLEYQRTADASSRRKLLDDYEHRGSDALALDELTQLIGLLPPPEPDRTTDSAPREMETRASAGQVVRYGLRLPKEYSHGRPYPVLIALHQAGETPKEALDRWAQEAGRYGYILAAPEWAEPGQTEYGYSEREHDTVLATLRDLRRHFAVDSDRVFLAGCGAGGDMAYDVGLSHPDLFAGVVPMSAFPAPSWPYRYRFNAQHLPFYVIVGDRSGDNRDTRAMFKEWVPLGYPVLYVQYRGRGLEWFGGELPNVFDWLDRKKRANPTGGIGRFGGLAGGEFVTMRSTDNHFYWLGVDELDPRQLNEGPRFNVRILGATLQANRRGNSVSIRTQGVRRLTVWFAQGDGTTDFDRPVTIYANGSKRWERKLTPSRETLLEDLYARGDRQRLYVARVTLDVR
jgi:hypothetical protein